MSPHEIRSTLLANGYYPLPLSGKRCFLTGWSESPIDEARVNSWRRKHAPNAGIRCDNIAVIDFDITDESVLDAAFDVVLAKLGGDPLERIGNAPKTALLYRIDDAGTKMRTGKHGGQEVEFLVGPGCQMAAIGIHPTTLKPYDWGGVSPMDMPRDKLPLIKFADLIALREEITTLFESAGLSLDENDQFSPTDSSKNDLALDMEFETRDYGLLTAEAIRDMLENRGGSIRANPTAYRLDSNTFSCIFSVGEQGLHLTDFPQAITHYLDDSDVALEFAALLPALPEAHPALAPEVASSHGLLAEIAAQWVHILADNTVRHIDRPFKPISMRAFENQHKFKVGNAWAITEWLQMPNCLKAGGVAMLPDRGAGVHVARDGDTVLNTYAPPVHVLAGGDTAVFDEFIEHLFPLRGECQIFLDWLAHKVQNPHVRAHGLVLVAQKYGTGRGTLIGSILKHLFGAAYVTPSVELAHFLGSTTTSQGQYNDYMVNSLLVCVSEARTSGSPSWKEGAEVMERLKERIDTQASDVMIKRKTVGNSTETTYASVIIATQHYDALPLPEDDRRLLVLTNGDPITPELADAINEWARSDANIAALYHTLLTRRVKYNPHGTPPATVGRDIMVREAKSALDLLAELYVKEAPGDVCYLAQFKDFCNKYSAVVDGELPTGHYDKAATGALVKFGAIRGEKIKISTPVGPRVTWVLRPRKVDLRIANLAGPADDGKRNSVFRSEIKKNEVSAILEGLPGLLLSD